MLIALIVFFILSVALNGDTYSANMIIRGFGNLLTSIGYYLTGKAARKGTVTWQ